MFDKFLTAEDNSSPSVLAEYYLRLDAMSPAEKLLRCIQLSNGVRGFVIAGIEQRYPTASVEEVRKRFAALTLGKEFTVKQFGWDPEVEGY